MLPVFPDATCRSNHSRTGKVSLFRAIPICTFLDQLRMGAGQAGNELDHVMSRNGLLDGCSTICASREVPSKASEGLNAGHLVSGRIKNEAKPRHCCQDDDSRLYCTPTNALSEESSSSFGDPSQWIKRMPSLKAISISKEVMFPPRRSPRTTCCLTASSYLASDKNACSSLT